MRLNDKVDIERTARRFQLGPQDVREALAQVMQEKGEVSISVSKRREELTQYIRHVYDEMAKTWNFHDMVHMLATYHTELIARGIVNPERFGKEAAKVAADVSKFVYPKETAKITRRLPQGETKEEILARLVDRLGEHKLAASTLEAPARLDGGADKSVSEVESLVEAEVVAEQSPEQDDLVSLDSNLG